MRQPVLTDEPRPSLHSRIISHEPSHLTAKTQESTREVQGANLGFGLGHPKSQSGNNDMSTSLSHKAVLNVPLGSLLLLKSPKLTFRAYDSSLIFAKISKIRAKSCTSAYSKVRCSSRTSNTSCAHSPLEQAILSFVHQAGQQAFRMIIDLGGRLSKCNVGVVAKGHDASVGDLPREAIFPPEGLRLRVGPGVDGITAEAVNSQNTIIRSRSVKAVE